MNTLKIILYYFSNVMILVYLVIAFVLFFTDSVFEIEKTQRYILASIILFYAGFKIYRLYVLKKRNDGENGVL